MSGLFFLPLKHSQFLKISAYKIISIIGQILLIIKEKKT